MEPEAPKQAAKKTDDEIPPAAEGTPLDNLPSMRIGYWMDRLVSGVEKLSVLDQQVGRIRQQVVEEEKKQQEGMMKVKNSGEEEGEEKSGDGRGRIYQRGWVFIGVVDPDSYWIRIQELCGSGSIF